MSKANGEIHSTGGEKARSSDWLASREAGSHGSHETDRKGSSSVGPQRCPNGDIVFWIDHGFFNTGLLPMTRQGTAKRSYEVAERRANVKAHESSEQSTKENNE